MDSHHTVPHITQKVEGQPCFRAEEAAVLTSETELLPLCLCCEDPAYEGLVVLVVDLSHLTDPAAFQMGISPQRRGQGFICLALVLRCTACDSDLFCNFYTLKISFRVRQL